MDHDKVILPCIPAEIGQHELSISFSVGDFMRFKTLIACVAAVTLSAGSANAALVGSFSDSRSASTGSAVDVIQVNFGFGGSSASSLAIPALLVDEQLTSNMVYSISSGTEFDEAVAFLTDGLASRMLIANRFFNMGSQSSANGTAYSLANTFGLGSPDFQGLVLTQIVLTISNLQLSTGPSGGSYSYDFRVDVYDDTMAAVPLPAAAPLFMAGLAGIGFMRRRRAAKS